MADLKDELYRLEEKKKAIIKLGVDKLRCELLKWWDKCYAGIEERNSFKFYDCDYNTEDILVFYEFKINLLKSHYEENIEIYNMYNKRNFVWEKLMSLENKANEPNRLRNRGGQLLYEERERIHLNAQLPKIENDLLDLVKEYKTMNGLPFKINGKNLDDIIQEEWKEQRNDKKRQSSARRRLREQVVTPRATKSTHTPSTASVQTPTMSTRKRKLSLAPISQVPKRTRIDPTSKSNLKSSAPNSTNKVKTLDRQRRLQNIRKRAQVKAANESNYENFEGGLTSKNSCNSSIIPDRILRSTSKDLLHLPDNKPQKVLGFVNAQPQRTPARKVLRTKIPSLVTPRLAALPENLPIII